jgi:hypothetical protein
MFLVKSIAALSLKDIVELSTSRMGYSLGVAKNLSHQRADTIVGCALLGLSVMLQFIVWWKFTGIDFRANRMGIILAISIGLISCKVSNRLYENAYRQVEALLGRGDMLGVSSNN